MATGVSSPARCNPASRLASLRSVLTRSPEPFGMRTGHHVAAHPHRSEQALEVITGGARLVAGPDPFRLPEPFDETSDRVSVVENLACGASRRSYAERRPSSRDEGSKDSRGVRAAGSITKASLALIGIPVALAAMLLFTYGVLFAFYWLGR